MKKRFISLLVALSITLTFLPIGAVAATPIRIGNLKYTVNADGESVTVSGTSGNPTQLNIESSISSNGRNYTVTEMRKNRISLKKHILDRFWEEKEESKYDTESHVYINEELVQKLSAEKILEEDMESAVLFCERTGRKSYNTQTECYIGYRETGRMTYWVEYKPVQDSGVCKYELINGYQHRMQIEMERIWNGKKVK